MAYQNGNFKVTNSSFFAFYVGVGIVLAYILNSNYVINMSWPRLFFWLIVLGIPYSLFEIIYIIWCEQHLLPEIIFPYILMGALIIPMIGRLIFGIIFEEFIQAMIWAVLIVVEMFFLGIIVPVAMVLYDSVANKITDFIIKK